MCPFCTNLVETAKHCLWSCDFVIEIWRRAVTLLKLVSPQAVCTWGALLWVVGKDNLMVYEQQDVVDAFFPPQKNTPSH